MKAHPKTYLRPAFWMPKSETSPVKQELQCLMEVRPPKAGLGILEIWPRSLCFSLCSIMPSCCGVTLQDQMGKPGQSCSEVRSVTALRNARSWGPGWHVGTGKKVCHKLRSVLELHWKGCIPKTTPVLTNGHFLVKKLCHRTIPVWPYPLLHAGGLQFQLKACRLT